MRDEGPSVPDLPTYVDLPPEPDARLVPVEACSVSVDGALELLGERQRVRIEEREVLHVQRRR